jgi:hypothetical protein
VIGLAKLAELDMSVPAPAEHVLRFDIFELHIRAGEFAKTGSQARLPETPEVLGPRQFKFLKLQDRKEVLMPLAKNRCFSFQGVSR